MENKKQLIIIPPMSDALKKLNVILESIAEEENVEVSLIDDLKELSQFVSNIGQCLILASNAKKCATFLQENKILLAKANCKTILFTPKEIPTKTLIKFTKIGLTESILESSPPKTFLYKVKLMLRSIKTSKPVEENEKLVKSLENGKQAEEEIAERDVKEKISAEENVIDMDMGKKKRNDDSAESIDYGNPLKGKLRPNEESIDTNWKSGRKTDSEIEKAEEENMTAESELSSIDMYYRGKNKKSDNLFESGEDDFGKLKKVELVDDSSPTANRKNSYSDIIDEGSMKQKRLDQEDQELMDNEKKSSIELDIISASKKNKKSFDDIDSELELTLKRKRLDDEEEEGAKTKDKKVEELGGYLKGVISKETGTLAEPEIKTETEYDNSEIKKNDRPKDFNLNLLDGDNKDQKNKDAVELEDNVHEGEVDQINTNMIGDEGTVDKIRTRMNGSTDGSGNVIEDEDEGLILYNKESNSSQEEKSREQENDLLETQSNTKDKATEAKKDDEEELELKKPQSNLDLLSGDRKSAPTSTVDPQERERQKQAFLEKLKAEKAAKAAARQEDDEELQLRSRHSSENKHENEGNQSHDGQVDKIDTFYRGGESKKSEHSWDNLIDKKSTLELLPGQKRSGMSTVAADSKNLGETTIDYRKLKEEFDLMASGGVKGADSDASSTKGDNNLRNSDDDGSFKVVEIDPKSLDFSITIVNSIYNKDIKAKQIFAMMADELVASYHCFPVFYSFKLSDKKFTEIYNTFLEISDSKMPLDKKEWWNEFKKDTALFEHYQTKSMTTWRCPEIINNNEVWEDVELPSWAEQELKTKQVELIFPYFDGLDRMGLAVVIFPDGVNPTSANGLLTILEMARTLYLDTIQRYQVVPVKEEMLTDALPEEQTKMKNVLSFFGGLFGKKKAG